MTFDVSQKDCKCRLALDLFIFSYLRGGIAFVDMAYLTRENIVNGRVIYKRRKTHREVNVPLLKEALAIVEKYCDECSDTGYLFPIIRRASSFDGATTEKSHTQSVSSSEYSFAASRKRCGYLYRPHHLRGSPHLCDGTQTRGSECCADLRISRTLEYPNDSNLSRLLRKLADWRGDEAFAMKDMGIICWIGWIILILVFLTERRFHHVC